MNDGSADSNTPTKGIAVTAVNDAPTLTTTVANLSYEENDGPQNVDAGLTATDPDSANFQGATVQITANHVQAEDELAFTNQLGISGSYDDSTGTLTLTGTTTVADYQAALRTVTYENNADNPTVSTRTVSFQATDTGKPAEQHRHARHRRRPGERLTGCDHLGRLHRLHRGRCRSADRQRPSRWRTRTTRTSRAPR